MRKVITRIIAWGRGHVSALVAVGISLLLVGLVVLLSHLRTSRVDDIKNHAIEVLERSGYDVVGYEGYMGGLTDDYGGKVWYSVVRRGDLHRHLYNVSITRWGSEYHLYNLRNVDVGISGCQ